MIPAIASSELQWESFVAVCENCPKYFKGLPGAKVDPIQAEHHAIMHSQKTGHNVLGTIRRDVRISVARRGHG